MVLVGVGMHDLNPFMLFIVKNKQTFHPAQASHECGLTLMVRFFFLVSVFDFFHMQLQERYKTHISFESFLS